MSTPGGHHHLQQQPQPGGGFPFSSASASGPSGQHPHTYHYHHHHQYIQQQHQPQSPSSSLGGSGGSNEVFTQEMRDRQARGKDPYVSGDMSPSYSSSDEYDDDDDDDDDDEDEDEDGSGDDGGGGAARGTGMGMGTRLRGRIMMMAGGGSGSSSAGAGRLTAHEDYGRAERRQKAAAFLDTPELLMMYAQSTGRTLPAARLHFMKMLCGYDDGRDSSSGRALTQGEEMSEDVHASLAGGRVGRRARVGGGK